MTATTLLAPAPRPASVTYTVLTDKIEIPRGWDFTAIEGSPVKAGDLALFKIGEKLSAGRWFPNIGGYDFIVQPGLLIACVGDTPIQLVGPIIPQNEISSEWEAEDDDMNDDDDTTWKFAKHLAALRARPDGAAKLAFIEALIEKPDLIGPVAATLAARRRQAQPTA